jgi:hypothetical protein
MFHVFIHRKLMSITKRINRYYTVENKHTKLINEHYGVENEYYRKESTRTTVWKTSIAQNINENYIAENEHNRMKRRALRWATRSLQKWINLSITVGTEHSAGKRLFPWRSNGGWEGRGTKRAVPLQLVPLDRKADLFFIKKKKLCIPSERCVEPGSHG